MSELELTPRPRIKKLSSAIVWIAAIFAVAVLWLVGYLVSSKARRPSQERRVAAVPPRVDDRAERIQRAAEREAKLAAEHAAMARGQQLQAPRELPPGFEQLLAEQDHPLAAGPPVESYGREAPYRGGGGADTGRSPLQRALDSELVPAGFRSASPRAAARAPAGSVASRIWVRASAAHSRVAGCCRTRSQGPAPGAPSRSASVDEFAERRRRKDVFR